MTHFWVSVKILVKKVHLTVVKFPYIYSYFTFHEKKNVNTSLSLFFSPFWSLTEVKGLKWFVKGDLSIFSLLEFIVVTVWNATILMTEVRTHVDIRTKYFEERIIPGKSSLTDSHERLVSSPLFLLDPSSMQKSDLFPVLMDNSLCFVLFYVSFLEAKILLFLKYIINDNIMYVRMVHNQCTASNLLSALYTLKWET